MITVVVRKTCTRIRSASQTINIPLTVSKQRLTEWLTADADPWHYAVGDYRRIIADMSAGKPPFLFSQTLRPFSFNLLISPDDVVVAGAVLILRHV